MADGTKDNIKERAKNICKIITQFCTYLLEKMGYSVDKVPESIILLLKHLFLFIICITMTIISFISIQKIGAYLILFHTMNITYKCLVLFWQKNNFEKREKQQSTSAKNKISSPYHLQFTLISVSVILSLVIFFLGVIEFQGVTLKICYTIGVSFSIIITFLKEMLDGIVILYNANI